MGDVFLGMFLCAVLLPALGMKKVVYIFIYNYMCVYIYPIETSSCKVMGIPGCQGAWPILQKDPEQIQ